MDAKGGVAGDHGEVGIEGDEFGLVVDGEGGDEEVKGTGIKALLATLLAEFGGLPPELGGDGEKREGGELGLNPFPLLRGGVAENLEGNRLAEAGGGVEDPRQDQRLQGGRGFPAGEINPQTGFDQSRHASERV